MTSSDLPVPASILPFLTADLSVSENRILHGGKTSSEETPDWPALVAKVRAEEKGADRLLIDELWPRLMGIIVNLCPRRDSTEDLAQESFLRIFSKLYQWRGGDFESWCKQLTRRVCYDALRKRRVRPEWIFSEMEHPPDERYHGVEESSRSSLGESLDTLNVLFNQLPPEMAWLLSEVELRGESIGAVSISMGWSSTAGRLRLMRARRRLQQAFLKLETQP